MGAVNWIFRLIDRASGPASKIERGAERTEQALRRTDRALARTGGGFGGLARAGASSAAVVGNAWTAAGRRLGIFQGQVATLRGALLGLGAVGVGGLGLGALGKMALDGAGARESSLASLETLLKTQDQGRIREAAGWIDRFADITPFEDRDVMSSVRQLLAAQFEFEEVRGLARVTGDTASALGTDPADSAQKWESINRALGQIRAKGRLQGEELLQLAEAGVAGDKFLEDALGPGYRDRMQRGQISASEGIRALVEGMDREYGGAMERQSRTLLGLASTLKSRPSRVFGQLFDRGGLAEAKWFFENLVDLTDFSKPPGKRALDRMLQSGAKLTRALFGPLADATEGEEGARTIERMLDRLDQFSGWWERNGPRIGAEMRGFGGGLRTVGEGANAALSPLLKLMALFDRKGGGSDEGMLGKLLGMGAGLWLLNMLSFGLLKTVARGAGKRIFGRGVATAAETALPAGRGARPPVAPASPASPRTGRLEPWLTRWDTRRAAQRGQRQGRRGVEIDPDLSRPGRGRLRRRGPQRRSVLRERAARRRPLMERARNTGRRLGRRVGRMAGRRLLPTLIGGLPYWERHSRALERARTLARGRGRAARPGGLRASTRTGRPTALARARALGRGGLARARTLGQGALTAARGALPRMLQFASRIGPLLARALPWILRVGAGIVGAMTPLGWVVAGVTAIGTAAVLAYRRFEPFRNLVDRIGGGIKSLVRDALDVGRNLGLGLLESMPPWLERLLTEGWGMVSGLFGSAPQAPRAPSPVPHIVLTPDVQAEVAQAVQAPPPPLRSPVSVSPTLNFHIHGAVNQSAVNDIATQTHDVMFTVATEGGWAPRD